MLRGKSAAVCAAERLVNGSKVEGRNRRTRRLRAVREQRGDITLTAEAAEYRKTQAILADQAADFARLPIAASTVSALTAM